MPRSIVPSPPDATASNPEPSPWRRQLARVARAGLWLGAGDRVNALGMVVLCAYYVIDGGVFQGKASGDGWFGFNYLRAIFQFHTLDMHDALPQFVQFFGVSGPGHHMPNRCPFGPVFVWAPFYLVALGVQWL